MNKVFWCGVLATPLLACDAPPAEQAATPSAPVEAPLPLAETVLLNTTPFRDVIALNGETMPVRQAMVSSEMAGRVSRFLLEEGQAIEAGTLVMRVSTTMLGPEREQLETMRAQLDVDIARQEQLIERGLGTTADLQRLQTEAQLTQQRIEAMILTLDLPEVARQQIRALTPANYIGLAVALTERLLEAPSDLESE